MSTALPDRPSGPPHHVPLWLRELPFIVVLLLTVGGVAYTSFSRQPIVVYWEILAPLIGLTCIAIGWRSDDEGRLRLVATQVLHWIAFLLVMNLMLLDSVQRLFTANSTAIAVFTLLALGTFTAGVHIFSWQICLLGLIMALGIPAIAWIENSALLIFVVIAAVAAVAAVIWWWWWHERRHAAHRPPTV
jgi:hypothetical protein